MTARNRIAFVLLAAGLGVTGVARAQDSVQAAPAAPATDSAQAGAAAHGGHGQGQGHGAAAQGQGQGHGQAQGAHGGGKGQGQGHGAHAGGGGQGGHATGWAELDAFHAVMMETWHPAKRNDDLAPIRAKAALMAERADAWVASTPPATCTANDLGTTVKAIAADAHALAGKAEANAPDAEVKSALAALHDRFEGVMHACAGGRGQGEGHGQH